MAFMLTFCISYTLLLIGRCEGHATILFFSYLVEADRPFYLHDAAAAPIGIVVFLLLH